MVRMKVLASMVFCDNCQQAPAVLFCCADEAALCAECDRDIHQANILAYKHEKLCFITGSAGQEQQQHPKCDICQELSGFFFCVEDKALLCRNCDILLHQNSKFGYRHSRYLVPGIKVELNASPPDCSLFPGGGSTPAFNTPQATFGLGHPFTNTSARSEHFSKTAELKVPVSASAAPASVPTPAHAQTPSSASPSAGAAEPPPTPAAVPSVLTRRSSDLSEILSENWKMDELYDIPQLGECYSLGDIHSTQTDVSNLADSDWTVDLPLFDERMYADSLHEVPQMLQFSPAAENRPARVGSLIKWKGKEVYLGRELDAFLVPEMVSNSAPVSQPPVKKRRMFVENL